MNLGPAFTDDLLLFSNARTNNAILIAGDDLAFDGLVYAPLGSAMLSGDNFTLRCGVRANEIAINGWGHRFTGDPTCGNHPPIAVDDAYTTTEDVVLSVKALGVLGNDSDADGDPLTASLVADVSNGTFRLCRRTGRSRIHHLRISMALTPSRMKPVTRVPHPRVPLLR